jgi:hypothetical protein
MKSDWMKMMTNTALALLGMTAISCAMAFAQTSAAPAPKHDLTGVWAGPGIATLNPVPPMTAWGQAQFNTSKPFSGPRLLPAGDSNDPMIMCDPLGFPRNVLWETRGVAFVQTAAVVVELFQYEHTFRMIWTDGRELPKNAGGDAIDAPDSRYYGYAIGHWDGDSFVADTVGIDENPWLDQLGHPQSSQMKVQERITRADRDTLNVTVNINDPKAYTKPFEAGHITYKLEPKQAELPEQLCIPTQAALYRSTIATPAAPKTSSKK